MVPSAHRIGQIRDVHIYRFVSQHTVEEAMLRKANQKRSLDDLVIQKGQFDWRSLFNDEGALTRALEEFEDREDAHAAAMAVREEIVMGDADEADFADDGGNAGTEVLEPTISDHTQEVPIQVEEEAEDEQGGTTIDFMISFVERDYDFFKDWRI
jgi:helicase SWR1